MVGNINTLPKWAKERILTLLAKVEQLNKNEAKLSESKEVMRIAVESGDVSALKSFLEKNG